MRTRVFTFFLIILIGLIGAGAILAQAATPLTPAQQQQLQAQLDQLEQQIAEQQQILAQKKQEGSSISRDIAILDAQIKEAQLQIQAHNIAIQQLGKDIGTKQQTINDLSAQIDQEKQSLADILEKTNELDHISIASALLSNANLTDFFADVGSYSALQNSLQTLFGQVQTAKAATEVQKENLNDQRNKEISVKINVEAEQQKIKQAESDKQKLLALNKQEQKSYQSVIDDNQKKAAAIRDALFALRDTSAIKFGDALQYANAVSVKTGVRPAFLLAILTQETNLGANIGSCYMTDDTDGSGVKITSGNPVNNVMKASRDVQPFLTLMSALGHDPHHTPVSCPQSIGYGGGMGPSQFIPSTWALLQSQISRATGKTTPDPFDPGDAFMATGIYLENLGASGGSSAAERNAACKYYSGKSCTTQAYNGFYGDSVMKIAANLQANIDVLTQAQ